MASKPKPLVVLHVQPDAERSPRRVLAAFVLSFLFNGVVFGVLFTWNSYRPTATAVEPDSYNVLPPDSADDEKKLDLEVDRIGLDPTKNGDFESTRREEDAFPGPVIPALDAGSQGKPDEMATYLPTPSGPARQGIGDGPVIPEGPKVTHGTSRQNGLDQRKSGSSRAEMVTTYGGNAFSEAAVASGLMWLAGHQSPTGRWSFTDFHRDGHCNCTGQVNHDDVAATALALLPFLAAGQTHKSGPSTGNRYTKQVDLGLKHLVLRQNRNGEFHPLMYSQGLATMAVCEAYGLTSDVALRNSAQRALDYIVAAQSKEGGWRYGRQQPGYDTSVGGWQLMALKSGQMAGLNVPASAMNDAKKWLNDAGVADGGAYGYTSRGEGVRTTAVGLLCRQYLGWGPRNPGIEAGIKRLQAWKPQPTDTYFSYYASQVMHHNGGQAWELWNPTMRDGLIAAQDRGQDPQHPHQKGSWYHKGGYGGRLMDTSLSLLTLEIYYRHLPLYARGVGTDKAILEP